MFLLSLTATCQVCTVSLKAGLSTYNRFTRRALYPPDGDPTHTEAGIMRVACETPAPATGGFVCELKAEGEEESEHEFNKDLAMAKQLKVGRFVSKIDSDGPVFAGPFGYCAHVSPQVIRSRQRMRHDRGNTLSYQDNREGLRALPLKAMECGKIQPQLHRVPP
jgi:hypothetical protein